MSSNEKVLCYVERDVKSRKPSTVENRYGKLQSRRRAETFQRREKARPYDAEKVRQGVIGEALQR